MDLVSPFTAPRLAYWPTLLVCEISRYVARSLAVPYCSLVVTSWNGFRFFCVFYCAVPEPSWTAASLLFNSGWELRVYEQTGRIQWLKSKVACLQTNVEVWQFNGTEQKEDNFFHCTISNFSTYLIINKLLHKLMDYTNLFWRYYLYYDVLVELIIWR